MNFQGKPCRACGEIIEVYSLSGFCRECFHARRGGQKKHDKHRYRDLGVMGDKVFCLRCGRPLRSPSYCFNCKDGINKEYLGKYRLISRGREVLPEHRYLYILFHGSIPRGFIIHHLNGLRGDNRKENLFAVKPRHHNGSALILETQKRIRELEGKRE